MLSPESYHALLLVQLDIIHDLYSYLRRYLALKNRPIVGLSTDFVVESYQTNQIRVRLNYTSPEGSYSDHIDIPLQLFYQGESYLDELENPTSTIAQDETEYDLYLTLKKKYEKA